MAEDILYVVRDTNQDLLFYLNSAGILHAEVKPGSAPANLPTGPLPLLLRNVIVDDGVEEGDDTYIEVLLKFIYDRGLYVDEIFIEVDEDDNDFPDVEEE